MGTELASTIGQPKVESFHFSFYEKETDNFHFFLTFTIQIT